MEDWEALIVIDNAHKIGNRPLQEYLQSVASFRLRQTKYRLFSWSPSPSATGSNADAVWPLVSAATCGADLTGMDSTKPWVEAIQQSACATLTVETPEITTGFIPFAVTFSPVPGGSLAPLRSIVLPKGFGPAAIPAYLHLLDAFAAAESAYAANNPEAFRAALQETLGIDSMYPPALLLGADAYEKSHEWETSLRLLEPVIPASGCGPAAPAGRLVVLIEAVGKERNVFPGFTGA
jgi:hypothetical protein